MTEAALPIARAPHVKVLSAVSVAHFVSHYYILLLAPLLPFVREDYGVSYTEIGFALAAFNLVSSALQTPAGFLVDRLGARALLAAGLILGAAAFIVAGLAQSFWLFVAMFAVAGVANTVYHPADYALLSQHIPGQSIGQAFSIHTFAGMLGSALAPPTLLLLHNAWGWRGAFIVSGAAGILVAALVAAIPSTPATKAAPKREDEKPHWDVLMSAPILLNLAFFLLLGIMSAGIYNYSVVALNGLYGTPIATASAALTGYLLAGAAGVLVGGFLAGRTGRHALVAGCGLTVTAAFIMLIAAVDLGAAGLIAAMTVAGFFSGVIMPSRDMIVRAVTPPGSFGKVFGFVTTGFSLGGIVAPLLLGPILDHGSPRFVFIAVAALIVLAIATVATRAPR